MCVCAASGWALVGVFDFCTFACAGRCMSGGRCVFLSSSLLFALCVRVRVCIMCTDAVRGDSHPRWMVVAVGGACEGTHGDGCEKGRASCFVSGCTSFCDTCDWLRRVRVRVSAGWVGGWVLVCRSCCVYACATCVLVCCVCRGGWFGGVSLPSVLTRFGLIRNS